MVQHLAHLVFVVQIHRLIFFSSEAHRVWRKKKYVHQSRCHVSLLYSLQRLASPDSSLGVPHCFWHSLQKVTMPFFWSLKQSLCCFPVPTQQLLPQSVRSSMGWERRLDTHHFGPVSQVVAIWLPGWECWIWSVLVYIHPPPPISDWETIAKRLVEVW